MPLHSNWLSLTIEHGLKILYRWQYNLMQLLSPLWSRTWHWPRDKSPLSWQSVRRLISIDLFPECQNWFLSKDICGSDQWAAVRLHRVANQWVAWGDRFHPNQFKTTFYLPAIVECRLMVLQMWQKKLSCGGWVGAWWISKLFGLILSKPTDYKWFMMGFC